MLLRVLKSYLRPYRKWLVAVVALQFVGTMAALMLPSLNADIIDNGVVVGDTDYIVGTGAIMLGVSLVQIVCAAFAVYFGSRAAMALGRDLRAGIFSHVGTFSARELNQFGAPTLITRTGNDVQQIQMMVMTGATMMVTAPIMMVGGILMAMREDIGLARILLVSIPVLVVLIALVVTRMVPGFSVMQERIDSVNRILREQITGIRVVRAFVREPFETRRFGRANEELTAVALSTGRWMASMLPSVMLVLNLSLVGVLWFGGVRVEAGAMQIGAITAFITYLMQILMSLMMATFTLVMVPRASVSAKRIAEVLDTTTSIALPLNPSRPREATGIVEMADVGFSYPGAEEPVVTGVSFIAQPGEMTAIIGSTGTGKTTLVNLIPRLLDVTEGTVLVDGVDVRGQEPESLWAGIGLVPQRAYLFSGTIADNLRHGKPDASETEMWQALEISQARDFVERMPEGLDAPVAQGGTNLSGGQRQRLAISRAVIKRPRVYVFDDAFSALDVATDARLRLALAREVADTTVIVVAQRVATIRGADQIVVLEDGTVADKGTHDELMSRCEPYQEIVESQLSIEDVA